MIYDRCPDMMCHTMKRCMAEGMPHSCWLEMLPPSTEAYLDNEQRKLDTEYDLFQQIAAEKLAVVHLTFGYRFGTYLSLRIWELLETDFSEVSTVLIAWATCLLCWGYLFELIFD